MVLSKRVSAYLSNNHNDYSCDMSVMVMCGYNSIYAGAYLLILNNILKILYISYTLPHYEEVMVH